MPSSQPSVIIPASSSEAAWAALIPEDQWDAFLAGTRALEGARVRALLGGAMALATYTGHWRNTKDVDVIIQAHERDRAVAALKDAGFADYFDCEAYDRTWIFRGFRNGVIFDVIWALPNHRVEIDDAWFARSRELRLLGRTYQSVPPEELVRVKLYVLQRNRCDWVDVLNVLASATTSIDWRWLVERMGRDLPLLHGVLAIFNWMCAGRAAELPSWLRERFALPMTNSEDVSAMEERRTRLLDSRPWFAQHQPADRPLEL